MTSNAVANYEYHTQGRRDNIIDLDAYRSLPTMESRRYVLIPVEETIPYTPRPRRDHHKAERMSFIHNVLNLTVIGVTVLLTSGLLGII